MNNSIERLIDGMVAALRHEVIPATTGEFARGQAFGVIYMLESLKLRTDWSAAFVEEQRAALLELRERLPVEMADGFPDAEAPDFALLADSWVCDAYDRIAPRNFDSGLTVALDAYVHRCLRHEISTSARPMFAQMSTGEEEPTR